MQNDHANDLRERSLLAGVLSRAHPPPVKIRCRALFETPAASSTRLTSYSSLKIRDGSGPRLCRSSLRASLPIIIPPGRVIWFSNIPTVMIAHSQLAPLPSELPFRIVSKTIGQGAYAWLVGVAPPLVPRLELTSALLALRKQHRFILQNLSSPSNSFTKILLFAMAV